MKEFSEFSKEDQKLICEAMALNNDAALNAIKGIYVNNETAFKNIIENMSYDAKLYMIEVLKNSLPVEYR